MDVPINGLPALKLVNYYGGFIIYGHSQKQSLNIHANLLAESTDRDKLDFMLAGINVAAHQQGDTVLVRVEAPIAQRNKKYSCGLNLFIPYGMPVCINYAKTAIITNELDSLVITRNAQSSILLARHRGSADLEAQSHINLEIDALWKHCYIKAVTDSGDINLRLPKRTNATILAQSFYNPIELDNIELAVYVRSFYTANGIVGSGDALINLKTIYGTVRLKIE